MCVGGSVFAMLLSGGLGFYAASIIPPETASSIAAHVKFGAAAVAAIAPVEIFNLSR